MRYSFAFVALAAIARAQDSTSVSIWTLETTIPDTPADALDFAGIEAVADPTYTEIPGLASQDIPYATATAISSAAADITSAPLSVFPAATDVPMNADGESDSSTAVEKRDLGKRTACAPQPTISNVYNVDVSSYANFKADPVIASVASAAAAPAGYYQNFVNLPGASSAYAYLGYSQVSSYNVTSCAEKCNKKTGCLAFNIYFERDPTLEPSINGACDNPAPFANIKCSFWGSILTSQTATNTGQWQSKFQVGIAGSNGYTSYSTGGPIDGCGSPLSLNTSVMNAPLRDCQGTWTYMGYKLFTSGPYDPRLCKSACDAQSAYNTAHPPTDGSNLAICSGFGSYLLTKTNKTGVYPQGQMCTLYTSGWGKQYAVNTASYDDSVGAKYTYTLSYFYNITALQPKCPSASDCNQPFKCPYSLQQCASKSNTYCWSNLSGGSKTGSWGTWDGQSCGEFPTCTTDSDCPSGDYCSPDTCCGYSICFPLATCSNTVAPSRMFRLKARDIEIVKKRDNSTCVPSPIDSCS